MGREPLDPGIDRVAMGDDPGDDLPGQCAGDGARFVLRELALQDRGGGPLAEVRLEYRRERDAPARPEAPDAVGSVPARGAASRRRHR